MLKLLCKSNVQKIKSDKDILHSIFSGDFFVFLCQWKNYFSGDLFSKALAFLTIPIFTRLLSPSDFGFLGVYTSLTGILMVFFALNFKGSMIRYFYEKNRDLKGFIGTNLVFLAIINVIFLIFGFLAKDWISQKMNIPSVLLISAVFVANLGVVQNIYLPILKAERKSKNVRDIQVIKGVLLTILSIGLMCLLKENIYLGKVYADIFIAGIIFLYFTNKIVERSNITIKKKHIKYSLLFGLPLIPHALSTTILSAFDKIIINQIVDSASAGIYSFSYQIGLVMNMLVLSAVTAWNPYFYEFRNKLEYERINNVIRTYSKTIYLSAFGLILFSKEIVHLMANKEYHSGIDIIPTIILSYVMFFLYTIYVSYSFYQKRTLLISINTMISAGLNIILNYQLIPIYGYKIAATTTLISFTVLFILHYINSKHILKEKIVPLKVLIPNFILLCLFGLIYTYIPEEIAYPHIILLKIALITLFSLIIFRDMIKNYCISGVVNEENKK